MCTLENMLNAYQVWASKNKSKCNPKTHSLYTQIVLKVNSQNQANVIIDPADLAVKIGVKEPRVIMETLDILSEANLIIWLYRSKNGKKNHEIALINFYANDFLDTEKPHPRVFQEESKSIPEVHPGTHPDLSSYVRDLEYNNINNKSLATLGGRESANAAVANEKRSIRIPTLRQRIDEFATANPNKYPLMFYEKFIEYYGGPDKKFPGQQIWESMLDTDGRFNAAARLEYSWGVVRVDYPGWVVGKGYPEIPDQQPRPSDSHRPTHDLPQSVSPSVYYGLFAGEQATAPPPMDCPTNPFDAAHRLAS